MFKVSNTDKRPQRHFHELVKKRWGVKKYQLVTHDNSDAPGCPLKELNTILTNKSLALDLSIFPSLLFTNSPIPWKQLYCTSLLIAAGLVTERRMILTFDEAFYTPIVALSKLGKLVILIKGSIKLCNLILKNANIQANELFLGISLKCLLLISF